MPRSTALALIFIALTPFLAVFYPPFPDAIGHLGRYAVQLGFERQSEFALYYSYDLRLIGNMGVDFMVEALGPSWGIERVVKFATILVPVLGVSGLLLTSAGLLGRLSPMLGLSAMFLLNFPFLFGFLNFSLSASICLNLFGIWMLLRTHPFLRAALFLPSAFLLYLCHVFGWGMLGLLVFGYEAFGNRPLRPLDWRHLLSSALKTAPLWLPILHMVLWQGSNPDAETGGISIDRKIAALALSLQDRHLILDVAFVAVACLPIIQAFRKDDFVFDSRAVRVFAPLFLGYVIVPNVVFGSAYADVRLAPFVLGFAILAVKPIKAATAIAWGGAILFGLRAFLVGYTAYQEEQELREYLPLFDGLERGSALYQINGHSCSQTVVKTNRLLGAYHIRRNAGYSNATWDMGDSNPLRISHRIPIDYRTDPVAASGAWGCEARELDRPQTLYDRLPRGIFDYVLFVEKPAAMNLRSDDRLVAKVKDAEIYRLANSN